MNNHGIRRFGISGICSLLLIFPAAASAQECLPVPDGLISWWPGDGNALDIEGSNHGTLVGGATYTPGKVSDGFSLDGGIARVEIPDAPSLHPTDAVTIEAWVRVDVTPDGVGAHLVDRHSSGSDTPHQGYVLGASTNAGGSLTVYTNTGTYWIVSSTDIEGDGEFHHVAGTYDGSAVKVYVDGILDASTPGSGSLIYPAPLDLWLGSNQQPSAYGRQLQGVLDEVKIYDRALSAAEIEAIFDAGVAGTCKDEDSDGFRPPADCDETDPSINPDAIERPGNFADENCDGNLGACDPCFVWRNHGEYVRCVSQAVDDLVSSGVLSEEEGDALVGSAARSDIGKRSYVAPECP